MARVITMAKTVLATVAILLGSSSAAVAEQLSYVPDLAKRTANMEGQIPLPMLAGTKLPKGDVLFEDGELSIRILPEWNFDKVPLLCGPIIRAEVTTVGKEGLISGIVYFRKGYWINRLPAPRNEETVTTSAGLTYTGNVTGFTADSIALATSNGNAVTIPWTEVKELHSPRAFAFAIPAVSSTPLSPDSAWQANVQVVKLTPTAQTPRLAHLQTDPLMRGDGDVSTGKLIVLGTALSLVEIAQFAPDLIVGLTSNHFQKVAHNKQLFALTGSYAPFAPLPTAPMPTAVPTP